MVHVRKRKKIVCECLCLFVGARYLFCDGFIDAIKSNIQIVEHSSYNVYTL